jgi:hypothetical protein
VGLSCLRLRFPDCSSSCPSCAPLLAAAGSPAAASSAYVRPAAPSRVSHVLPMVGSPPPTGAARRALPPQLEPRRDVAGAAAQRPAGRGRQRAGSALLRGYRTGRRVAGLMSGSGVEGVKAQAASAVAQQQRRAGGRLRAEQL